MKTDSTLTDEQIVEAIEVAGYPVEDVGMAFAIVRLGAVLATQGAATPPAPEPSEHPWRCFHCGDVFHDTEAATEHFGPSEYSTPICKIDATEYRRMEEQHRRNCAEDTDKDREMAAMESRHQVALVREEEAGYAKGLRDARAEVATPPAIREPEPHWRIALDEDAAALLRDSIGRGDYTDEASPVTLSVGPGVDGYGLYVWLTEQPAEGSILLAALATPAPAPSIPVVHPISTPSNVERGGASNSPGMSALSDEQIVTGAKVICKRVANSCNTDLDEEWKNYGRLYLDDMRAVSAALATTRSTGAEPYVGGD